MDSNLIFDVGFHNGDDTAYYLSKGYRVVAVEANPLLAQLGETRFAREIAEGRLTIVNAAIADREGQITLWVNDQKSDWSSTDRNVGGRDGTRCHAVEVPAVRFESLLARYGVPYYLKSDIETADVLCLQALKPDDTPKYLSIEAHRIEYFVLMHSLGYRDFKCVDQLRHNEGLLPFSNESVLGRAVRLASHYRNGVDRRLRRMIGLPAGQFPMGSSGPFGEETPGEWQDLENAVYDWLHFKRSETRRGTLNMRSWFDIHARRP